MTLDDPLGDGPPDREDLGQEGGQDYDDEEMGRGGEDEQGGEEELGWEEKYADDFEPMTNNDRENKWEEVGKKGRPTPLQPTAGEGNQVKTSNKQGGRTEAGDGAKATMVTDGSTRGSEGNSFESNENHKGKMKAIFPKVSPGGQILWGDDEDEDDEDSQTFQTMMYTKKDKQGNIITVNANEYTENDEPIEALPKHQIFARMEIYVKKGEEGEGAKVNHTEKIKNMVAYMLEMDNSLTFLPARGGNFGVEEIEDFPKTYDRLETFFKIEKEEYQAEAEDS
jgi:ribosomal protein S24E